MYYTYNLSPFLSFLILPTTTKKLESLLYFTVNIELYASSFIINSLYYCMYIATLLVSVTLQLYSSNQELRAMILDLGWIMISYLNAIFDICIYNFTLF